MEMSQPEVLTFRQFTAKKGYDCEISHDRLRFPHGISKIQARRNREAAKHHLAEAFRALSDYDQAVAEGSVRPPTEDEQASERIIAHPDHEATKATWRVRVKRMQRLNPEVSTLDAVLRILRENLDGKDPWVAELGLPNDASLEEIAQARITWMNGGKLHNKRMAHEVIHI